MYHNNSAKNRKHFLKDNFNITGNNNTTDVYTKLRPFCPNKLNDINSYVTYRTNNKGKIKKLFKPKLIKIKEIPNFKKIFLNKNHSKNNNNIQNNYSTNYNQFYTPTSHLSKRSNNKSEERISNTNSGIKTNKNLYDIPNFKKIIFNKNHLCSNNTQNNVSNTYNRFYTPNSYLGKRDNKKSAERINNISNVLKMSTSNKKKKPLINNNSFNHNHTENHNLNPYYTYIDVLKKKNNYNLLPKSYDSIDLNSKNKIDSVNLKINNNIIHYSKIKVEENYNLDKIILIQSFWRSYNFRKIVADGIERFYCSLAIYKYLYNIFINYKKRYFNDFFFNIYERTSRNSFDDNYSSKKKYNRIVNSFVKKSRNKNYIENEDLKNGNGSLRLKKSADNFLANYRNNKNTKKYIYKKRRLKNCSNLGVKSFSKNRNIKVNSPFTNNYSTVYNSKKENVLCNAKDVTQLSCLFKIISKKYLQLYYPIFIYLLKIFKEIDILIKKKDKLVQIIKKINNKDLRKYYNKYRKNVLILKAKEMFYKEKKIKKRNLNNKIYQKKLTSNKTENPNNLNWIKVNINLNLQRSKSFNTNKKLDILKKFVNNKIEILNNSNLIRIQYYFNKWKKKISNHQLSNTSSDNIKVNVNKNDYDDFVRRTNSSLSSGKKKYIKVRHCRAYSERKPNVVNDNNSKKRVNNHTASKKIKFILSEPSVFADYDDCPVGKVASLVNKIEKKKIMFKYYNMWKKIN